MRDYCDIIPEHNGWVYVIDGVQSRSYYHTYDLAMDGAKAELARRGAARQKVFRKQEVSGEMLPVSSVTPFPSMNRVSNQARIGRQ